MFFRAVLPTWLHDYLTYRFDLLDRTGDGEIDSEEFEYVLTEFGIRGKDSKQAFEIFSQHGAVKVDFVYFVRLFEEFGGRESPPSSSLSASRSRVRESPDGGASGAAARGPPPVVA